MYSFIQTHRHKKTILSNMSTGLTNSLKLLLAGKQCRRMPETAGTARQLSLYGDVRIVGWELLCAGLVCEYIIEKIRSIELNTGTEVSFVRLLYLRLTHIY